MGPQNLRFLVILAAIVLFMWLISRSAKKAQQRAEAARDESLVIGAHVVTKSGFYGTVVSIDGDAVTLESPAGDETVWARQAIHGQAEIPLAPLSEAEYLEESQHADASADSHAADTTLDEAPESAASSDAAGSEDEVRPSRTEEK